MGSIKKRNYVGLIVSIFMIFFGIWKLYNFFAPTVGPIGNGPTVTIIYFVWILFIINMIVGVGGVIYFAYSIFRKK